MRTIDGSSCMNVILVKVCALLLHVGWNLGVGCSCVVCCCVEAHVECKYVCAGLGEMVGDVRVCIKPVESVEGFGLGGRSGNTISVCV